MQENEHDTTMENESRGGVSQTAGWLIGGGGAGVLVFIATFFIQSLQSQEKDHFDELSRRITELRETYLQGRNERMASDTSLSSRIDDLNARFAELQRQVSTVEVAILGLQGVQGLDVKPLGKKP